MARRMYARTLEDGSFNVGIEDFDPVAEREAKAEAVARQVQGGISEAYRSPFTYNAALAAARLLLAEESLTPTPAEIEPPDYSCRGNGERPIV